MGHPSALDSFLNLHREQLLRSGVPEHYWNVLNQKLLNQTFDAGSAFQLVKIEYEEEKKPFEPTWGVQALSNISKTNPQHIYLIDHAWTFRVGHAKNQLKEFDTLRGRMNNILGLPGKVDVEEDAEEIFQNVWRVCNTYSIGNADEIEDRLPVWYVMDELGSAVMHSDEPNCRIVPFVYVNEQVTYSILFPICDIEEDDLIYRDYAEGVTNEIRRKALLLPWKPCDFKEFPIDPPMPEPDYYLAGHIKEHLPSESNLANIRLPQGRKLKVYSEYSLINSFLTDDNFEIVDNEDEADILWYTKHFKDFETLAEKPKFVNQFPFEYVLTVKDLLCLTCRRSKNLNPLPETYMLETEIQYFLSYFQKREEEGLENYWIIKPYNLARGLDIHITNNINYICRLPATGPKIAQKYITNPVLFYRPECDGKVKFDLRYVILLKSVEPLEAYVYKEFFLRFANKPFELNDFHIYEKHFTVMNYTSDAELRHMLCSEFKEQWKTFYPDHDWNTIEKSIMDMLGHVLNCAILAKPPCGLAANPQSRALYAADLMLEWSTDGKIVPKLLEINWAPDCKRACEYYPNFFNDIFNLMFLNKETNNCYKL